MKIRRPKSALILAGSIVALLAGPRVQAANFWFDQNGVTAGFGVANAGLYDWNGTSFWNATSAGSGAVSTWAGGNAAFFVGAGAATSYTITLGAADNATVSLGNFALNSDGTNATAIGAGDVVIGGVGSTGTLALNAANSIGTASGTLTINSKYNLGANQTTNFRGGTVIINGVISGTGTSGVVLASGAFGLTSGTLTLAGNNTFTGNTSVASGYTLNLQHASALGATGGTNTVSSGGTLEVAGGVTIVSGESVTLNGPGITTTSIGALRAGTGGGTWAGGVSLGDASVRVGALAAQTLTITGSIANGATGTGFNVSGQSGTGVVIINPTTSNSYTGTTGIIRGILRLGKTDALPTGTTLDVDSANAVAEAATFDLASFSQTVAVLQDTATTNINGKITNSVASTTSTLTVNQASNTVYDSIIENGSGTVVLTKAGAGSLTLNGANTYTGGTNIKNGSIIIGAANDRLAAGGAVVLGDVATSGKLVLGDATTARNQTLAGLTVTGLGGSVVGAQATTNSVLTLSNASGINTFSGILGGGGINENNLALTKTGAGTLNLNGPNTYAGPTTVTLGTLQIGSGSVGSVGLITSGPIGTGALNLTGGTISSDGATARTLLNAVTYSNSSTFGSVTNNGKLTFSGAVNLGTAVKTVTANSDVQFDGILSGTAAGAGISLGTSTGFGKVTLANNSNDFAGPVSFAANSGTLRITSSGALGVGPKTVTNTAASASVPTTGANLLELDSNGGADIALASNISFVTSGSGGVILNTAGNNTIAGNFTMSSGNGNTRIISNGGTLTLPGIFTPNTTLRELDLTGSSVGNLFSGALVNGSATNVPALTKNGSGTWTVSGGANTFTGNTKVNGGTLKLTNNLAIQNSAFDTSGAGALDLTDIAINTLTIGGLIGDAATGQNLVLPANVTSLTLNPTVSATTNTYVKNFSGGASGLTVTKSGAGTQILSGTNSYTGLTTVNAGELRVTSAGAIGGSNVTVNSGFQLTMDGGVTVSGKTLNTSGSGTNFLGGLQSVSGVNEWAGAVILGADLSRIGARKGATLVASGTVDDGPSTFGLVIRNETFGTGTNGAGNGGTVTVLSGASTYGGPTQLIAGVTKLDGGDNRLPVGTVLQFGSGNVNSKFDMNGRSQELAGLAVTSTGTDTNRDWNANELTNSSGTLSTLTLNTVTDQSFGGTLANYVGIITGKIALVKSGAAKLTLSGTNSYTDGTRIDAGTLTLGHATDTLANGGAVNVNGGILALGTNTDTVGAVTLTSGSITGSGAGALTGTGSNFDVRSGSVSAILGGTIGLDKTTGGTVTLTGVNAYTGATGISGGALTLSGAGAINTSSGITINGSGAKLVQASSVAISPAVTLTQGTLTGSGTVNTVNVGAGTGGIISNNDGLGGTPLTIGALTLAGGASINLFSNGTAADLIVTTLTNNSAANDVTITANSATGWVNSTTYNLIGYTTLGGTGLNNFAHAVNNLSARQSAAWSDTGSAIQITVTGTNPYWVGDTDNKWNLSTANNWRLLSDNSYTTFLATDDVLFDDNASGVGAVTVDIDLANVAPNSTVFDNNTRAYTLSSSGSGSGFGISSGSLTKSNNGSVIISTVNSYTGPTVINGGNLTIGGSGTLGSGSALTMGGGQLDLGGTSQTMGSVSITAPAAAGSTILNGTLTGTSYAASNTTGNAIISANLLANGAAGFTKTGAGTVTLSGTNTWTGATAINGGSVVLNGAGALANVSSLNLGGGSIDLGGVSRTVGVVSITAAAASGDTISNGSLTGTSYAASNATGNAIVSANLLANGAIGFTKTGAGTVTLAGANTYTGATAINAGTLAVGSATAFTNLGALTMSGTSTFDLNGNNASFAGNVLAGVSTSTITDSSASAGTSTVTFGQTTGTTVTTGALITDGTTRKVGISFSNNNGAQQFTNANNTFSGGLTLLNNATAGTRMQIAAVPIFTGTPGALTSGTYGTGAIIVGQAPTDKAGIYLNAANATLANAVVANTGLGTDRVGTFRIDSTGNTFSGQLTAGASDFTLSTNLSGSVNLTGKITGNNGLKLLSHNLGGTALTVMLTNAAGTNDYAGNTTINENPQTGKTYSLVLGAADQIPNGPGKGNVVVNTSGNGAGTGVGKLDLAGFSETINGLSGNGNVTSATAATLSVGDNDATGLANTFSGTATGALALTKIGNGMLTLGGANTYTGVTTVAFGTLRAQSNAALGSNVAGTTIASGATLDVGGTLAVNALNLGTEAITISGTGVGGNGALVNNGSNDQTNAVQRLTLGADATIGGTQRWDVRGTGSILDGNFALTKVGANTVSLVTTTVSVKDINVNAGMLSIEFGANVNNTNSGTISVGGSGTLGVGNFGSVITVSKPIALANGATFKTTSTGGNGEAAIAANIALTGTSFINPQATSTLTLNGILSGDGFTQNDAGTVVLSGQNTFTGGTTISAGKLQLNRVTADNSAIPTDANTATTSDILINGGTLEIASSEQIGDSGSIAMSSGALNFGTATGKTETIDKLTVSGGTFSTGANSLIVGGATVTWSGGTNTISTGGLVSDKHWVVSDGTNTVQNTGVLRVQSGTGTVGLFFGGTSSPTITLDSHASDPGEILLKQDVTVDSTLTSGTARILSGGSAAHAGSIDMNGGVRNFTINDGSATVDMLITANLNNGGLTKSGNGTLSLAGANDYTGTSTINAGVLKVDNDGSTTFGRIIGSTVTGSIAINSGGTLLLSGSGDHIDNNAAVTLNGGTFNTDGLSETVGVLTLSSDSVIDMGAGASILRFADSSAASWSGTLSIWNWSGNQNVGGGTDQLFFGNGSGTGLQTSQLSQIKFYSDAGSTVLPFSPGFSAFTGSFGEVAPVPEPSTVATVMGLLGLVGWRENRRGRALARSARR